MRKVNADNVIFKDHIVTDGTDCFLVADKNLIYVLGMIFKLIKSNMIAIGKVNVEAQKGGIMLAGLKFTKLDNVLKDISDRLEKLEALTNAKDYEYQEKTEKKLTKKTK